MTYNNYSISYGKGMLYLKSKEPKEGFEKVFYGTDNKVTYHKYAKIIQGVLTKVETKELEFEGKKLHFMEVTLVDGDTTNRVSTPLKNSKGNYTDEVKSLVSALNGAEFGEVVTLSISKTKSEKTGKDFLNVYVNYTQRLGENGKGLSTGYIPFDEIPRPEKEEDEDLGVSWNWKPVNKFFAQKIKELESRSLNGSGAPTTAEKVVVNKKVAVTEGADDLPF